MPLGVASPACSAIVQQFLRGRSASNANRNPRTRRRSSTRPNRPAIRSSSSSTPADQPADPTLARATTAEPSDVLTPDDGYAVAARFSNQDQAIYGWSTSRGNVPSAKFGALLSEPGTLLSESAGDSLAVHISRIESHSNVTSNLTTERHVPRIHLAVSRRRIRCQGLRKRASSTAPGLTRCRTAKPWA